MSDQGEAGRPSGPDDQTLLFVYNVDASPVAMLRDLVTGLRTGVTDCHLCDLTFGTLLKDRSWKSFVDDLPIDVDFCLRSTALRDHPTLVGREFPAAFLLEADAEPVEVLSASQINAVEDLDDLRTLVTRTVADLDLDSTNP